MISGQGTTPTQSNAPTSSTPAPDKPGNFVGIQQYLEQNKPQSAKLASDVGDYVQGQGEAAKTALAQGQGQFDQAVGQNTVGLDQDLFKQAKETPEQVDADADKKAEFQKMRDAQYKGPSSLESSDYYQPINMAIQNALGAANNTQTAIGRTQLLGDVAKQNHQQISRGASNLDAALLSASPDSRNILSQARDQVTPIQDQMSAVTQAENMKAKAAADQTAATQKAIQDAFSGPNGVQGQLESDLQARANQAKTQSGGLADSVLAKLKSGDRNMSDQELGILGINRNQYNGLLNDQQFYKTRSQPTLLSDLSSFATRQSPDAQVTPQNIATPEDYARYSALNDLMGTSNGFLNDPSQAGKAKLDALDFNYGATPNALVDRVNSISSPALNPETQNATSFKEMNNLFNLDSGAKLGNTSIPNAASIVNSIASYPSSYGPYYSNVLNSLKDSLGSINQAYGTNLQVPAEYLDKANKTVRAGMAQILANPNVVTGGVKAQPSDADYSKVAQLMAYTTFLNDLQKDTAKVRG